VDLIIWALSLLFDPAFAKQAFHKSACRQETRLDPTCSSQVLHELALRVIGKRHFFAFCNSRKSDGPRSSGGVAGLITERLHRLGWDHLLPNI